MKKGTYAIKQDANKEQSGIDLNLGDLGQFKLARAGGENEKYARMLMQASKPYRRAIQAGSLDPKIDVRILAEVYATTVIQSWEGVTDEAGSPLPFTKDNAIKVLTDLPELFRELRLAAESAALYRVEEVEADSKNS